MAVGEKESLVLAERDEHVPRATRTARRRCSDRESGAGFDKSYVDTQVKEHQAVLDMIDQKLLPNAQDPR